MKLINHNTTIPTKKLQVFSTAADIQTAIKVKIFQGECELVGDNKLLSNSNLIGNPPTPKGVLQIEITFNIDTDGNVHINAKDKATRKDQLTMIASSSGPSDKDIECMVADAEKYADVDKPHRELIEEANQSALTPKRSALADLDGSDYEESVNTQISALPSASSRSQPGFEEALRSAQLQLDIEWTHNRELKEKNIVLEANKLQCSKKNVLPELLAYDSEIKMLAKKYSVTIELFFPCTL
ncbi:hypothetical protein PISMIDRAFT_16736 [Pisolithus microcarpus 441]|uniref:Uncharacterized protein n=1 Tax=Pisolithus microcarpus 441 TaxID=765257 RepID=A0A0C9YY99_9AGAM|nr:Hsp70 protein-domain-containing protein [Pisolithus microcarpus]KIK15137.1 hypothetical protein PISMIDRAFT_16736 [Pisolithus microcarpus 441]